MLSQAGGVQGRRGSLSNPKGVLLSGLGAGFGSLSSAGPLVAINGSERGWQKALQVHGRRAAHAGPA